MDEQVATAEFHETDRFTEISELKDGWSGDDSKAVSASVLAEGRRLRDLIVQAGIPCCVFPTFEGGVSIEDSADEMEDSFAITINPDLTALVMSFDEHNAEEDHPDARKLPVSSAWLTQLLA